MAEGLKDNTTLTSLKYAAHNFELLALATICSPPDEHLNFPCTPHPAAWNITTSMMALSGPSKQPLEASNSPSSMQLWCASANP